MIRTPHSRALRNPSTLSSLLGDASRRCLSTRPGLQHLSPLIGTKPNVLIVKKSQDARVTKASDDIIRHIKLKYPETNMYIEPSETSFRSLCKQFTPGTCPKIDLIVTLGGDGTILRASSLFREGPVPPVLSFSLGTLGFLLPFHIDSFPRALDDVYHGKSTVLLRMRLACKFRDAHGKHLSGTTPGGYQLMNEVTLHRGRNPHLTIIDAFVDGQHLTESVSDGLIVSTPTGSTAYSLSSGGPIVHPSMQSLLLTPICPRSLSFRPVMLPGTAKVTLKISRKSRAPTEVSMDGHDVRLLHPGESIVVEASPYPIPCINRPTLDMALDGQPHQDGWVHDINRLLQFNASFKSSASGHLDSDTQERLIMEEEDLIQQQRT